MTPQSSFVWTYSTTFTQSILIWNDVKASKWIFINIIFCTWTANVSFPIQRLKHLTVIPTNIYSLRASLFLIFASVSISFSYCLAIDFLWIGLFLCACSKLPHTPLLWIYSTNKFLLWWVNCSISSLLKIIPAFPNISLFFFSTSVL